MKLEDIQIYPCLTSEASNIQGVKIPNGCDLYMFVESEEEGLQYKQKILDFYNDGEDNGFTIV